MTMNYILVMIQTDWADSFIPEQEEYASRIKSQPESKIQHTKFSNSNDDWINA